MVKKYNFFKRFVLEAVFFLVSNIHIALHQPPAKKVTDAVNHVDTTSFLLLFASWS